MNSDELLKCLKQMAAKKSMQYDVIPKDHLPTLDIEKYPAALIINTDPSTEAGEHWIVLYRRTPLSELEGFDR